MRNYLITGLLAATLLSGCNATQTVDTKEQQKQEAMKAEADMNVGMPALSNWQEKRMMKSIIEARDKALATTTYIVAENTGQMFKVCDSVGYALPYSTQYTNPNKVESLYGVNGNLHYVDGVIPQADPNGLFSPANAEGSWVLCLNPATKHDETVYLEPRVIVSPFPIVLTPVPFAIPK